MSDTKYDLDYLKSLLQEAEETEEVIVPPISVSETLEPSVRKFLAKNNIKSGEHKVPTYVLFMIYRTRFSGVNNKYKISNRRFFKEVNKVFDKIRDGNGLYYLIDKKFELTKKEKKNMKTQYDKYWWKGKKDDSRRSK